MTRALALFFMTALLAGAEVFFDGVEQGGGVTAESLADGTSIVANANGTLSANATNIAISGIPLGATATNLIIYAKEPGALELSINSSNRQLWGYVAGGGAAAMVLDWYNGTMLRRDSTNYTLNWATRKLNGDWTTEGQLTANSNVTAVGTVSAASFSGSGQSLTEVLNLTTSLSTTLSIPAATHLWFRVGALSGAHNTRPAGFRLAHAIGAGSAPGYMEFSANRVAGGDATPDFSWVRTATFGSLGDGTNVGYGAVGGDSSGNIYVALTNQSAAAQTFLLNVIGWSAGGSLPTLTITTQAITDVAAASIVYVTPGDYLYPDGLRTTGTVTAGSFAGNGNQITALNGANVTNLTVGAVIYRLAGVNSWAPTGLVGVASNNVDIATNSAILAGTAHAITNGRNSVIAGGFNNSMLYDYNENCFIGGGSGNRIQFGHNMAIAGGSTNRLNGDQYDNFIGGGRNNIGGGSWDAIGGGEDNIISANYSFIGGGQRNFVKIGGIGCVIAGGVDNAISNASPNSVIGGGQGNVVAGENGTVAGGENNKIAPTNAAGDAEDVRWAAIGGGTENIIERSLIMTNDGGFSDSGFIGAGEFNLLKGNCAVIGGGHFNYADGQEATIAGGFSNRVANHHATVIGGKRNSATGITSIAAGSFANARHDGAAVFHLGASLTLGGAQIERTEFESGATNQFSIKASGGVVLQPTGTTAAAIGTAALSVYGTMAVESTIQSNNVPTVNTTQTCGNARMMVMVNYTLSRAVASGNAILKLVTFNALVQTNTASDTSALTMSNSGVMMGSVDAGRTWALREESTAGSTATVTSVNYVIY